MKYTLTTGLMMSLIFSSLLIATGDAQTRYAKTPWDAEGPFYPVERRSDEDNDLLNVKGMSGSAKGDVLHLSGIVLDTNGTPQKDVVVEIWQTDRNGLYDHPRDWSEGQRDRFFQYWGKATTDDEGKYRFKTLLPGEYEPRPAHIHFKVWVGQEEVLTSQMYISKDPTKTLPVRKPLRLEVTKTDPGEYTGFFRIVY